jgi:hypothetical protein
MVGYTFAIKSVLCFASQHILHTYLPMYMQKMLRFVGTVTSFASSQNTFDMINCSVPTCMLILVLGYWNKTILSYKCLADQCVGIFGIFVTLFNLTDSCSPKTWCLSCWFKNICNLHILNFCYIYSIHFGRTSFLQSFSANVLKNACEIG